ncbi:MAG: hypothetical protein HKN07_14610, partial [Acidimicrobiia bacterium]|nr:hypothetical protein [Acidimicrobiia bacterium]
MVAYRAQIFADATFPWDFTGRVTTGPTFVAGVISTGQFPTWVPYQGSGAPMLSDIGSGIYYPITWLAGLLQIPLTLDLQTDLQVMTIIAGALGTVALLRARSIKWPWAILGGVA